MSVSDVKCLNKNNNYDEKILGSKLMREILYVILHIHELHKIM